jgi:cell pole-organizing protein PopZ
MINKEDDNEMSMEEILASIRRYVADDGPETNQTGLDYTSGHTAEVIRLTDAIDPHASSAVKSEFTPFAKTPDYAPYPKMAPPIENTAALQQNANESFKQQGEYQQQTTPRAFTPEIHEPVILPFQKGGYSPSQQQHVHQQNYTNVASNYEIPEPSDLSDVISERTVHSTSHAFSKLSEAFQMAKVEKDHYDAQKGHGASPIESFVIELAKPMVRQWIEEHLPGLVDKLVTQEIEKLTDEMRKKIF